MVSPPKAKLAMPRSSSPRHSWMYGSPRSARSNSSRGSAAKNQPEAFLAVPQNQESQPNVYTTPTNKDSMSYDNSTSSKDARVQRALAAPKKRDEVLEMTSARK